MGDDQIAEAKTVLVEHVGGEFGRCAACHGRHPCADRRDAESYLIREGVIEPRPGLGDLR